MHESTRELTSGSAGFIIFFTHFFPPLCFPFLSSVLPSQRWHCHILKHLSLGWHCCASLCLCVSPLLRTTQRDDMLAAHPGWVARLQERCGWQDQPSTDYGSNACRQCKNQSFGDLQKEQRWQFWINALWKKKKRGEKKSSLGALF